MTRRDHDMYMVTKQEDVDDHEDVDGRARRCWSWTLFEIDQEEIRVCVDDRARRCWSWTLFEIDQVDIRIC